MKQFIHTPRLVEIVLGILVWTVIAIVAWWAYHRFAHLGGPPLEWRITDDTTLQPLRDSHGSEVRLETQTDCLLVLSGFSVPGASSEQTKALRGVLHGKTVHCEPTKPLSGSYAWFLFNGGEWEGPFPTYQRCETAARTEGLAQDSYCAIAVLRPPELAK